MRLIFHTSIILALFTFPARAERPKDLSFPSPDGRWKITASWISDSDPNDSGHYAYELQDIKLGKSYFKEGYTDKSDETIAYPHRISAYWSPKGSYVAINVYYGRIAYWLSIIDVSGRYPREVPLFPEKMTDYDDFMTSADHWLDDNSLEVEAYQPVNWSEKHVVTAYKLVVRFEKGGSIVAKREKEQP